MKPPFPDSLHCPSVYLNFFFFSLFFITLLYRCSVDTTTRVLDRTNMPFATCALTLPQRTATGKKKKEGGKNSICAAVDTATIQDGTSTQAGLFLFYKNNEKREVKQKLTCADLCTYTHMYVQTAKHTHTQKKKRCGFIAFYARCHASERQEKKKKRYSILKKEQRLKYKNRKTQKDREELVIKKRREDLYKKHIFIYKWNHTENTEKKGGGKKKQRGTLRAALNATPNSPSFSFNPAAT